MPAQHRLLDVEEFRAEARAGRAPDAALLKYADSEPGIVTGASSRVRRFVFSTADVDHSNDVIKQDGWDTSVHRRNPVALFAHDSSALPIGRASNVGVVNGKLMGDIEFAGPETYEFADTVFQLVKGGFLKAVSVGFIPQDWKFTSDKSRPQGLDFIKSLLLEISICAIPANPHALIAARATGIDTRALRSWAERVLDGEGTSPTPRRDLEALRRQAAEPRSAKSGRRISAATRAKLEEMIGYHAAATKCATDLLEGAMGDDDDPNPDEAQTSALTREQRVANAARLKAEVGKVKPHDLTTPEGRVAKAAEQRRIWARREAAMALKSDLAGKGLLS